MDIGRYQLNYDGTDLYIKNEDNKRVGDSSSVHITGIKKKIGQIVTAFGLMFLIGWFMFEQRIFASENSLQLLLLFVPLTLGVTLALWLILGAIVDIDDYMYEHKKYKKILSEVIQTYPEKMFLAKSIYEVENKIVQEVTWELVDEPINSRSYAK